MSSEWDRKFARMVAETEHHLASVKSQLESPPPTRRVQFGSPHGPRRASEGAVKGLGHNGNIPFYLKKSTSSPTTATPTTPPTSILRRSSLSTNQLTNQLTPSPPSKRNVTFDLSVPPSSSTGLTLLSEKIRLQQKEMAGLRESVNSLQQCLQQQHGQIMALREEMHAIQMKLVESGAAFKLENKMKQFKQEIFLELETLKNKVQMTPSPPARVTPRPLSAHHDSEPFSSKLRRSEVIASLQREISSLKSRLVSQESKVTVVSMGVKEIKRSHEKVMCEAKEAISNSRKLDEMRDHSNQLQSLRDLLSSVKRRINIIERAVFKSENQNTSTPAGSPQVRFRTPTPSTTTRRMSDLDISPICAREPDRFAGGIKGHCPLYRASHSLDSYFDQGEGEEGDESGSTLSESWKGEEEERGREEERDEESDLDGHTLSCSLELMSELEASEDIIVSTSDDLVSLSTLT